MKRTGIAMALGLTAFTTGASTGFAQIASFSGDGVLNAPYRGTITSLREACMDMPYGEVMTWIEPTGPTASIQSSYIYVWNSLADGSPPWDRSVLRLYRELDASGAEIDLTTHTTESGAYRIDYPGSFARFSLKAIGTKTLATQTFKIKFKYVLNTGGTTRPLRTFRVAPVTGSFLSLPGESEAFHFGTPILDVQVGDARVTVPVGRKVQQIGACYEYYDKALGPSSIPINDMVLPWAAESVFIPVDSQFRIGGSASGPNKSFYGTPWAAYMVGWFTSGDTYWCATGSVWTIGYDVQQPNQDGFNPVTRVRPPDGTGQAGAMLYLYDPLQPQWLVEVQSEAGTGSIGLTRDPGTGAVTRISTSDGRGWTILADANNWIAAVIPDPGSGFAARYYTRADDGRVRQVMDGAGNVLHEFVYDPSGDLASEWQRIGGELVKTVEHETVSETLRRRKEYVSEADYRQIDLSYDPAAPSRLLSITTYSGLNGAGTPSTTVYTHEFDNPRGNVVLRSVDHPDGSRDSYEYDHQHGEPAAPAQAPYGLRSKHTWTDGVHWLVPLDVEYEFTYDDAGLTRLHYNPPIVARYVMPDADHDGDVDLNDFAQFQLCFNGAARPYAGPACGWSDGDADGDCDLNDFAVFQICFNGASRPPSCG